MKSARMKTAAGETKRRGKPLGCIVLCGVRGSKQFAFALDHRLDFRLKVVAVETKEELVDTLARLRPPLCILEYVIPIGATVKSEKTLMAEGLPREVARKLAGQVMDAVPAHVVMDEAAGASPDTRFIIVCNNKGYDVVKAHIDDYSRHPAVIKTMGVMNGSVNMKYLYKLFTRTYAGRTWKPTF